jgi:hypothetical protein
MEIETKLLCITAESRSRLMRKIWEMPASAGAHLRHRELITSELTLLRNELFRAITSSEMLSGWLCRKIAEDEGIPQVRKNICILAIYGIDAGCIADLNCVNIGYVKMCIRSLKKDYPELFR